MTENKITKEAAASSKNEDTGKKNETNKGEGSFETLVKKHKTCSTHS